MLHYIMANTQICLDTVCLKLTAEMHTDVLPQLLSCCQMLLYKLQASANLQQVTQLLHKNLHVLYVIVQKPTTADCKHSK